MNTCSTYEDVLTIVTIWRHCGLQKPDHFASHPDLQLRPPHWRGTRQSVKARFTIVRNIAIDGGSTDNTTSNLTSCAGRLSISVVRTVGCSVQNRDVAAACSEAVISSVEARHLDVFNGAFARRV